MSTMTRSIAGADPSERRLGDLADSCIEALKQECGRLKFETDRLKSRWPELSAEEKDLLRVKSDRLSRLASHISSANHYRAKATQLEARVTDARSAMDRATKALDDNLRDMDCHVSSWNDVHKKLNRTLPYGVIKVLGGPLDGMKGHIHMRLKRDNPTYDRYSREFSSKFKEICDSHGKCDGGCEYYVEVIARSKATIDRSVRICERARYELSKAPLVDGDLRRKLMELIESI